MLGKIYINKHTEKRRESEAKEKANTKHTKLRKKKRGKCNSKINRHRNKQTRARKRKSTRKTKKGGGKEMNITLPWQDVLYSQMRMTILTGNYWINNTHIAHLRQQCHNSKFVIFQEKLLKVLKCYNFRTSATTTQLLSSGEFCKLRYDTIPVKSASANVYFYTNN